MRGAGIRGIGALIAAAAAASCGWPEFAYAPASGDENQAGAGVGGEPSGGGSGTAGAPGGTTASGGSGGSSGSSAGDPCENEIRDGAETGVDCGGGTCPGCAPGGPCTIDRDCVAGCNTSISRCEPLTCDDDEASGTETDVDCGGPDCELRCQAGYECRDDSDCESRLCEQGRCVASACDPTNGPCGTSDCFCANGRDCTRHEDCASGNCADGTCAEGALVFSRNDEPNAEFELTPAVLQAFLVRNDAPSTIPLSEVSLRYYFSNDGLGEPQARCDESRAADANQCAGITTTVFEESTPFVDRVLEIRLPDAEALAPGALTLEIPIAIEPTGGGLYDQSNDQSFSAHASFDENARVTLYRRGVLIWGEEP